MYKPLAEGDKIARKYMGHLLNVTPKSTPTYERLGEDLEALDVDLSPEVEKKQNILGETSVNLSSYEVSATVEPYYARKGTPMGNYLQDIIDERKVLSDVVTDALEVHFWEPTTTGENPTAFVAYKEVVHVAPTSYGGDNTGYQIPFDLHYTGDRTKGTYDTTSKTFAPAA